jgi:NAD(P)-dependent dehydrogenase (short-subunit alcohol dehydrogenase family)
MARLADYPDDGWDRTMAVMLTGVYLCMKAEIPRMLERGGGAIVNTASGVGLVGYPGQAAYTASKHGVVGLTKVAALDYGAKGIRVNAICPGTARTPMVDDAVGRDPSIERYLETLHPIGRIAEAAEIAEAAVWLCTPAASFVLGVALPVDGGYVVP